MFFHLSISAITMKFLTINKRRQVYPSFNAYSLCNDGLVVKKNLFYSRDRLEFHGCFENWKAKNFLAV